MEVDGSDDLNLFNWMIFCFHVNFKGDLLPWTNIAMEIPAFVDVFPTGKGGFPASYVSFPEGSSSVFVGT